MKESARGVVVLGAPSAAGAGNPGIEDAPRALRAAGLEAALADAGRQVADRGDLPSFPFRMDAPSSRARNVNGVGDAIAATAGALENAHANELALILGGGCSLLAGVVLGLARRKGHAPGIALIDAHADFNTPETSASGYLDGMALAIACGQGPQAIIAQGGQWARPDEAALVGFRDLDPPERERLGTLALALSAESARAMGMDAVARRVLAVTGSGPLVVHLDVDALDPSEMPAKDGSPPGPGFQHSELVALLAGLLAAERTAALLVAGFNPHRDPDGRWARALVATLSRALGAKTNAHDA